MSHESPLTNHKSRGPTHESPFASARGERTTDIRTALSQAIAQFEREHTPSAALAAELLLMHTIGCDRTRLYSHPEQELDAAGRERYFSLITQRASGVPTQHLTGHQEFWGLEFEVSPDVLIPRPETEHLIEVALQRLGAEPNDASPQRDTELRIADVGTGSGCIAVALAKEFPSAHIVATDISAAALEIARRNAQRHDVAKRIDLIECNLLDALHESRITNHPSLSLWASESRPFDLIASNPPYIALHESQALPREVRDHEPHAALFGGETGTEIYAPLIAQAAMLLKPGGNLVLELGHNSANEVSRLLDTPDWTGVVLTNDLAGIRRVASARRSVS